MMQRLFLGLLLLQFSVSKVLCSTNTELLSNRRVAELNSIVDEYSPTKAYQLQTGEAVDGIVAYIRNKVRFQSLKVDHIFKGGSQKKGTVITSDSDVDLVVFLHGKFEDYDGKGALPFMADAIQREFPCRMIRRSSYVITLEYRNVSIDLLTAFDATITNQKDQVTEQRVRMREIVKDRPDKLYFSSSFTESSCEFVAKRTRVSGERLTRAIKLAKLWNKTQFQKDLSDPSSHKMILRSYALELILCDLYDSNKNLRGADLFVLLLRQLQEKRGRDVKFNDFFPHPIKTPNPTHRLLRVYDPCFPESDVVADFEGWNDLSTKAAETLEQIYSDREIRSLFTGGNPGHKSNTTFTQ